MASSTDGGTRLTIAALRRAGRDLAAPFTLCVGPRDLACESVLRWLPAGRLVARVRDASLGTVVLKLHLRSARGAMAAERAGLAALSQAGFSVPAILEEGLPGKDPPRDASVDGDVGVQFLQLLAPAQSLADCWPVFDDDERSAHLRTLGAGLARLHAAGARMRDPHLGNFLIHAGVLHALDGGGIETGSSPVAAAGRLQDLALLHAQLALDDDALARVTLAAYAGACEEHLAAEAEGRGANARADGSPRPVGPPAPLPVLRAAIVRARARRLRLVLRKSVRDCSEFAVAADARRFSVCRRASAPVLRSLHVAPDAAIAGGRLLKAGNTATVAQVQADDGTWLVCKRYNIKGPLHRLSRMWRRSRAEHSWLAAQHLAMLGIATAQPLALLEERLGPLRGRAFLWMRCMPGPTLAALAAEAGAAGVLLDAGLRERVARLLVRLHAAGLVHGDLKASNILLHGGEPVLVDLDALVQVAPGTRRLRAQARERARFLANWPARAERDAWVLALAAADAWWQARATA